MASSQKSLAWKYFDKVNENTVKCKICAVKLNYHKSTTGMLTHLKAKHPSVTLATTEKERGPQQSVIASFAVRPRQCDNVRAEKTSALIANMVAKDMLPISFVEGEGFRELMKFVEPEYTVPARKTITARLEKMHADSAASVCRNVSKAEKKVNEKPQIIADYEAGKAIPNNQIMGKIERAIGLKLRGREIGQPLEAKPKKK